MGENVQHGYRRMARTGLTALIGSCSLAVVLAGTASADTTIPLPDQTQNFTTATGLAVNLSHTGERAVVSPAIAANGMSRTAWVTGTAFATSPGATSGSLETGYLVGCQVDLSKGVSLGGDFYVDPGSLAPELSTSFALRPGQVVTVKLGTKNLDPKAGAVGVSYHDLGIQVDGCGGFAEARSYTNLTVAGSKGSTVVSIYGQPFSLG